MHSNALLIVSFEVCPTLIVVSVPAYELVVFFTLAVMHTCSNAVLLVIVISY